MVLEDRVEVTGARLEEVGRDDSLQKVLEDDAFAWNVWAFGKALLLRATAEQARDS